MTQIVNLNELVGGDIVFQYGEPVVEYRIPGDIDVDTVFELFEMFRHLSVVEGDDPEKVADDVRRQFFEIRDRLLALLQIRDPHLDSYPFGIRATGIILRTILAGLGMTVTDENPTPPSRPKPRPQRKKTTTTRRKK